MLAYKQALWQTLLEVVIASVILVLLLPCVAPIHVEARASGPPPFDPARLVFETVAGDYGSIWRIADLPTITGDWAMLRLAMANLIANALKFTRPRQEAQIEIGSIPVQASEAVIFVRDNGVGFDMRYMDKLFGVFQRLHRAEEFAGTGIGLATVRRIVARHGGRTWAKGNVDQGTTFCFSLSHSPQGGGDEKP